MWAKFDPVLVPPTCWKVASIRLDGTMFLRTEAEAAVRDRPSARVSVHVRITLSQRLRSPQRTPTMHLS